MKILMLVLCLISFHLMAQTKKEVNELNKKRKAWTKADEIYAKEQMAKSIKKLEKSLKAIYKKTIKVKVSPKLYEGDVYFAKNFDKNVSAPILDYLAKFCKGDKKKCAVILKGIKKISMQRNSLNRNSSYKYNKSDKRIDLVFSKWGSLDTRIFQRALYQISSDFFKDNADKVSSQKSTLKDIKRLEESYQEKLINNKTFYKNLISLIAGKNKKKKKVAEKIFWRNLKKEKYSLSLDDKSKTVLYSYLKTKTKTFSKSEFDLVASKTANDDHKGRLSFVQYVLKNFPKIKSDIRKHLLAMDWDGENRYIKDSREVKYWVIDTCSENSACSKKLIHNEFKLTKKEHLQIYKLAFKYSNTKFTDEIKKLNFSKLGLKKQKTILLGLQHVYANGVSISSGIESAFSKSIWKVFSKNKSLQPLYLGVLYAADDRNTEAYLKRQGKKFKVDEKFLLATKKEAPFAAIALSKVEAQSIAKNVKTKFYKDLSKIILEFGDNSENRLMTQKKRAIEAMIEPAAEMGQLNQLKSVLNTWLNKNPNLNDDFSYATRKIEKQIALKKKTKAKVAKKEAAKKEVYKYDAGAELLKEVKPKWDKLEKKLKAKSATQSDISEFVDLHQTDKVRFGILVSYYKKLFKYWGSMSRDAKIGLVQNLMLAGLMTKNKEALASIYASAAKKSGKANIAKDDNALIWWGWAYSVQKNINAVADLAQFYRYHYKSNDELKGLISSELLATSDAGFKGAWK